MRFILLVITVFFAFLTIATAQPKLEIVGGDTYNWGEITPNDSPLKTKIILKNVGLDTLDITRVKPTCGCTTAPLSKRILAPNDSAELNITLRISASQKKVIKSVYIFSNDPNEGKQTLFLKATVHKPIMILPETYFRLVEMTVGSPVKTVCKIMNKSDEEVVLTNAQTTPEELTVDFTGEKVLMPGDTVSVKVTVLPQKSGYFSGRVTIKTSNKEMPELKIQGFGQVKKSPIFNDQY